MLAVKQKWLLLGIMKHWCNHTVNSAKWGSVNRVITVLTDRNVFVFKRCLHISCIPFFYIICIRLLMDVPQYSLVCAEINFNTLPRGKLKGSDVCSRQYIYLLPTNYTS
jgi:hypothetical protein